MKKKIIVLLTVIVVVIAVFFVSKFRVIEGTLLVEDDICITLEGCGDYFLITDEFVNGLKQNYPLSGNVDEEDDGKRIRIYGLGTQESDKPSLGYTYYVIYVFWSSNLGR